MNNQDINIFHHVGLVSRNLESAVHRYEQLGFTFTPLSMPRIVLAKGSEAQIFGAGNRHAIFKNNYLEILGIVDKDIWSKIPKEKLGPYNLNTPLSRYEGLHVMHFGTDDLEAVRERMVGQGTQCSDIKPFQRSVDTPEGPRMMQAKTLYFPEDSNPEGLIQIAQHLTPELVLQPRYMRHKNGAQTITETIVCVPEPETLIYAEKYKMYTGCSYERKGCVHVIDLGLSRIIVVAPEHLDEIIPGYAPPTLPFLAGFTVSTKSLDEPRNVLTENGVPFHEHEGRLIVSPEHACGSAVLFESE